MKLSKLFIVNYSLDILGRHHDYAAGNKSYRDNRKAFSQRDKGTLEPIDSSESILQTLLSNVELVDESSLIKESFTTLAVDDTDDQRLIQEIVLGCVRWKKLLALTLKCFFVETGCRYLKADYNLFAVLFYIMLFKLAEFSNSELTSIFAEYDASKMYKMMVFLFDEKHRKDILRPLWISIVDEAYADEKLIQPYVASKERATDLVEKLKQRVQSGEQKDNVKKQATEPVPFLLTKPRPRKLPTPVNRGSLVHQALPVPKTTQEPSLELQVLAKKHVENRAAAISGQKEAEKQLFKVAQVPRFSSKTLDKIARIQLEKEALSNAFKAKPIMKQVPLKKSDQSTDSETIKLTTAAILREDALIRKELEKKELELKKLELGLRDASEFLKWKQELDDKEREKLALDQERKRLEIQILHEESILVRKRLEKENAFKGAAIKEESAKFKVQIEEFEQKVQDENKKKIEDVQLTKDNVKIVKTKVEQENKERAALLAQESEALLKQAKLQQQQELESKMALIKQIREMEKSLPPTGSIVKVVDLTETSNVGLMSEMSILELQDRLTSLKHEKEQLQQQKHESILEFRAEKSKMLHKKLELIKEQRQARGSKLHFSYQHMSSPHTPKKAPNQKQYLYGIDDFSDEHDRFSSTSTDLSNMGFVSKLQNSESYDTDSSGAESSFTHSSHKKIDYDSIDSSLKALQQKLLLKRQESDKYDGMVEKFTFTPGKRLGSPNVKKRPSPLVVFLIDLHVQQNSTQFIEDIINLIDGILHYFYFYVDSRVSWSAEWFDLPSSGSLMARPQRLPSQFVSKAAIDSLRNRLVAAFEHRIESEGAAKRQSSNRQSLSNLHNSAPRPLLANILTVLRRATSDYKWNATWTITKDTCVDFFSPVKATKRSYMASPSRAVGTSRVNNNNPFAFKATNVRNYCFLLSPLHLTTSDFIEYVWGETAGMQATNAAMELDDTMAEFGAQWVKQGLWEEYVLHNRIALNWVNTSHRCVAPTNDKLSKWLEAHLDLFGGLFLPLSRAINCIKSAPPLANILRRKVVETSAGQHWLRLRLEERNPFLLKHHARLSRRFGWAAGATKPVQLDANGCLNLVVTNALEKRGWFNSESFTFGECWPSYASENLEILSLESIAPNETWHVLGTVKLSKITPFCAVAGVRSSYPLPLLVLGDSPLTESNAKFSDLCACLSQMRSGLVVSVVCSVTEGSKSPQILNNEPDPFWVPPAAASKSQSERKEALLLPSFHSKGLYLVFLQPDWQQMVESNQQDTGNCSDMHCFYEWPLAIYPLCGDLLPPQDARASKFREYSSQVVSSSAASSSSDTGLPAEVELEQKQPFCETLADAESQVMARLTEVGLARSCSLSAIYVNLLPSLEAKIVNVASATMKSKVCCLFRAILVNLHTSSEIESRYSLFDNGIAEDIEACFGSQFSLSEIKVLRFLLQEHSANISEFFAHQGRVWESQLVLLYTLFLLELLSKYNSQVDFQYLTKQLHSASASPLANSILLLIQSNNFSAVQAQCDTILDRLLIDYVTVDLPYDYASEKIGQLQGDSDNVSDDNAVALLKLFKALPKSSGVSAKLVAHWSSKAGLDYYEEGARDGSLFPKPAMYSSPLLTPVKSIKRKSSTSNIPLFRPTSDSSRKILEKAYEEHQQRQSAVTEEAPPAGPETPRTARLRSRKEKEQKRVAALNKSKRLESFLAKRGIHCMTSKSVKR